MQDLLVSWFGTTGATFARLALAVVVVLALLLALRWILARTGAGGTIPFSRNRQQRLAVLDVAAVDSRRRLVLVRRDNVEHLLLIGGPTDLVVEQTIYRGVPVGSLARAPAAPAPVQAQPVPTGTASEPAVVPPPVASMPEPRERPKPVEAVTPPPPSVPIPPAMQPTPVPMPEPMLPKADVRPFPPIARPNRDLRPVRRPEDAPAGSPRGPAPVDAYVPPASTRVEPHADPIAPIVTDAAPPVRSVDAAAPVVKPAPADAPTGFDDLARRLDEALRVDLEEPRPAERREPPIAATPAPVRWRRRNPRSPRPRLRSRRRSRRPHRCGPTRRSPACLAPTRSSSRHVRPCPGPSRWRAGL